TFKSWLRDPGKGAMARGKFLRKDPYNVPALHNHIPNTGLIIDNAYPYTEDEIYSPEEIRAMPPEQLNQIIQRNFLYNRAQGYVLGEHNQKARGNTGDPSSGLAAFNPSSLLTLGMGRHGPFFSKKGNIANTIYTPEALDDAISNHQDDFQMKPMDPYWLEIADYENDSNPVPDYVRMQGLNPLEAYTFIHNN